MCSSGPERLAAGDAEERRAGRHRPHRHQRPAELLPALRPVVPHVGAVGEVDEHVHAERGAVAAVLGEQLDQPVGAVEVAVGAAGEDVAVAGPRRRAPAAASADPPIHSGIRRAGRGTSPARSIRWNALSWSTRSCSHSARSTSTWSSKPAGAVARTSCRATCTRRGSTRCRRRARAARPRAGRPRPPAWRRAPSAAGAGRARRWPARSGSCGRRGTRTARTARGTDRAGCTGRAAPGRGRRGRRRARGRRPSAARSRAPRPPGRSRGRRSGRRRSRSSGTRRRTASRRHVPASRATTGANVVHVALRDGHVGEAEPLAPLLQRVRRSSRRCRAGRGGGRRTPPRSRRSGRPSPLIIGPGSSSTATK